jgi:hypothetical protein
MPTSRPLLRAQKIQRLQQRIVRKRGSHSAVRPLEQDLTRLMVQQLRYEMRVK